MRGVVESSRGELDEPHGLAPLPCPALRETRPDPDEVKGKPAGLSSSGGPGGSRPDSGRSGRIAVGNDGTACRAAAGGRR